MTSKRLNIFPAIIAFVFSAFHFPGCVKKPWPDNTRIVEGTVIGRETCNSDSLLEYWIVDFNTTLPSDQLGDTIALSGTTYTNALKVRGLIAPFQLVGTKVGFEFKSVTDKKVITSGCNMLPSETFEIRELIFGAQGKGH